MVARRDTPDLVSVLEAAYDFDVDDGVWLRGLVESIRPAVDEGLGMAAYIYDTSLRPFRVRDLILDCPIDEAGLELLLDRSNDDYVRKSWRVCGASMASEVPGYERHAGVRDVFHPAGIHDIMILNTLDPVGIGCWIGAPRPSLDRLEPAERARWQRVAAHLRSALRLRLRLAGDTPSPSRDGAGETEAVLTRDGSFVHVEPSAESARHALRDAVLGMESARRELRSDADRALPSWKALVQARWTLVDDFESGTDRYIVARANGFSSAGPALLTARESQVVSCLALGLTNKEAAYELGLSHSTVRVLVARASAKLGATDRDDLVARFRRAKLG